MSKSASQYSYDAKDPALRGPGDHGHARAANPHPNRYLISSHGVPSLPEPLPCPLLSP